MIKASTKKLLSLIFGNHIFFLINYYLRSLFHNKYIIVVTYHDTPRVYLKQFEKQLTFFKKYFSNCTKSDLSLFLKSGVWKKAKPGIIITFDDGLMSNYNIAKPLLEKFGFSGWFMIPAQILELDAKSQYYFLKNSKIDVALDENATGIFMTSSNVRSLAEFGHEIVCHSYSHPRLSSELSQAELDREIQYSKKRLENTTGGEVDCFAWVGGEEEAYSSAALRKMIQSDYKFVFATNCGVVTARSQRFCIERFHIEPTYMMFQTCFAISWAYVLGYYFKRQRVNRKIFGS